jgi:acyl-CoA synthetase (NDP forming)
MKKVSLAVLVSLSALTGAAYAQQDNGITMSTDPQRAAEVEQHAQDVQNRQQAMESAPAPQHHKGKHPKMKMDKSAE